MWSVVIGGWFFWLSVYGTNQAMVQRYLSAEHKSSAVWYETIELNLKLNGLCFYISIRCMLRFFLNILVQYGGTV